MSIRLCTCRDANAWLIPAAVASDSKHPRYILAGMSGSANARNHALSNSAAVVGSHNAATAS